MSAAQLRQEKVDRSAELPALDPQRLEALSEEDVAELLLRRFRVFIELWLHCHDALVLAVTTDR